MLMVQRRFVFVFVFVCVYAFDNKWASLLSRGRVGLSKI